MADQTISVDPSRAAVVSGASTPPPKTLTPQSDFERNGASLTRKGMEEVVRKGQSVIYKGRSIGTLADLPTDAELAVAANDPAEVDRVRRDTQHQIDELRQKLDSMSKAQAQAKAAESKPSAKA